MELLARRLKLFAIAALFERTIVKQSDIAPSDVDLSRHFRYCGRASLSVFADILKATPRLREYVRCLHIIQCQLPSAASW
jgi:hypothetical protein